MILPGLFLLGLIIGSFLNVLIYRWNTPHSPSPLIGRSFCPECKHKLSWYDLVPLVSFVFLKAKCRYCHKNISWRYPIVELATGIVTVVVGLNPVNLVIAYSFIVIFFSDWVYGLIPDEAIILITIFSLISSAKAADQISNFLLSGLGAGLLFYLIYLITKKRGMGFGDVKLATAMGLLLGWPKILIALYSAFILGGSVALILLLLKRKRFGETIALGPFLVAGTLIAYLLNFQFSIFNFQ